MKLNKFTATFSFTPAINNEIPVFTNWLWGLLGCSTEDYRLIQCANYLGINPAGHYTAVIGKTGP